MQPLKADVCSSSSQGCFIFSLVKYKPLTYNKVYEYPDWAVGIGWTLALTSMICIPMVVVIKIIRSDGPLIEVGGNVCSFCRLWMYGIGFQSCFQASVQFSPCVPSLFSFCLVSCRGLRRWQPRSVVGPAPVPQTIVASRSSPTRWTPTGTRVC